PLPPANGPGRRTLEDRRGGAPTLRLATLDRAVKRIPIATHARRRSRPGAPPAVAVIGHPSYFRATMATFRARARALDMLGRQQIAGIPTAISELFKNAHDAYATRVEADYYREAQLFVLRD